MSDQLLPGFVVRRAESSRFDHWQGGSAIHEGAYCATCRRPWLLIWDINCADPRFICDGRPVFGDAGRLALYYCWKCCGEISYRIIDSQRVHLFESQGTFQGDDHPYSNYPIAFDRFPIELSRPEEMSEEVREFLATDPEDASPTQTSLHLKEQLEYWLDHPIGDIEFDIWWQQFGGEPWLIQGPENRPCPNPDCELGRSGVSMTILASISNHPLAGLPMIQTVDEVRNSNGVINRWVQVVVHICAECQTIHVCNRCD